MYNSSRTQANTDLCRYKKHKLINVIIISYLMYLKQILFPLVIFYNNCFTIHILDANYIQLYTFPDLVSCLLVFVLHVFVSF
jgi:hypothetical protein